MRKLFLAIATVIMFALTIVAGTFSGLYGVSVYVDAVPVENTQNPVEDEPKNEGPSEEDEESKEGEDKNDEETSEPGEGKEEEVATQSDNTEMTETEDPTTDPDETETPGETKEPDTSETPDESTDPTTPTKPIEPENPDENTEPTPDETPTTEDPSDTEPEAPEVEKVAKPLGEYLAEKLHFKGAIDAFGVETFRAMCWGLSAFFAILTGVLFVLLFKKYPKKQKKDKNKKNPTQDELKMRAIPVQPSQKNKPHGNSGLMF